MMAAILLAVAALAVGQTPDTAQANPGAEKVAPITANPGETSGDVARQSGLETDGGTVAEAPAPDAGAPAAAITPAPTGAGITLGLNEEEGVDGKISAQLRLTNTDVSWFPVDNLGNYAGPRPFETRLRVAPEVHFVGFGALAEFDAATGAVAGNPNPSLFADRVPVESFQPLLLRQLYLEYKWKTGVFRVGQQTSNWGLGLIANSGAKDAEAGDFGQARFGSLVYRALLAGRPLYSLGGNWRAIEAIAAADLVYSDDNAEFVNGDRAFQGVLALRFKVDDDRYFGFYGVYRQQRAYGVVDGGRATDVFVMDFAGRWAFNVSETSLFSVGAEAAGIVGTTTQARSITAQGPSQVRQFGAAAKLAYTVKRVKVMLDWGYASGDQNPQDDQIQGFRFDRDYKVGLVLFDQVLAYQSARAGLRASDAMLFGVAPEGVKQLPTGGAVYNAWYLFPRLKFAPVEWLDLYGGPLFAFSTAQLTDPFNTSVMGGSPHNYLGAKPGSYLGTELDLGVQARWRPHRLLLIIATLEGGVLLPGDAFMQPDGTVMGPVGLGRVRLTLQL
jgi:hypothetical protein